MYFWLYKTCYGDDMYKVSFILTLIISQARYLQMFLSSWGPIKELTATFVQTYSSTAYSTAFLAMLLINCNKEQG